MLKNTRGITEKPLVEMSELSKEEIIEMPEPSKETRMRFAEMRLIEKERNKFSELNFLHFLFESVLV